MKYLLDTNTCIQWLNGHEQVLERMSLEKPNDLALCSVVKAELYYGALKSGRPKRNLERLNLLFRGLGSFPFSDEASLIYGRIRVQLEKKGRIIGPNDLLIASIALAQACVLVTHNTKEFQRVEGLEIEDWESP